MRRLFRNQQNPVQLWVEASEPIERGSCMDVIEFNRLYYEFDNQMPNISHLSDVARIQLFQTYFEAHQKEQALQKSGLGNLQTMLGPLMEQVTNDLKDSNRGEDWRRED